MNILITGGGSISQRHIKNLQQLGYQNIWVLKRTYNAPFEEEHQVKVITSFEKAKTLDLDAVFVGTPTALHNESLRFGVEQGLHIFMEKPLIHNQAGLDEARELMKDYDKIFFIGFMMRYHPLVQQIKGVIDSGRLGKVYNARFSFGSYLPYWHPWEDYKTSYASRKELGGGVINTITHELDLIQSFFGNPKALYCEASNLGKLDIAVEELCEATFDYGDKVVTLHLDYLQKDYDRNIKILCDEGKIVWDWHENQVKVYLHKGEAEIIELEDTFEVNQLYIDELKHFLSLIELKETQHPLDFGQADANTSLMLSMHESAERMAKVQL